MTTITQNFPTELLEEIRANAQRLGGDSIVLLADLLPGFEERFTRGERSTIGRQLARMVRAGEVPELEWFCRNAQNHQEYAIVPETNRQAELAA